MDLLKTGGSVITGDSVKVGSGRVLEIVGVDPNCEVVIGSASKADCVTSLTHSSS